MLTFISLFTGIGGIDLGLERAGMRCVAQVEINDYATKVLAKHWPTVARFRDVRSVGAHNLPQADVVAGGFPCQDISNAGRRAGITGERSGLWSEYARIVRELRPRYVLVENVAALLSRGIDRVLGDLAALGYDAEWECLPAAAVGAPHRRDRLFIVAYARSSRRWQNTRSAHGDETAHAGRAAPDDHEPECHGEGDRAGQVPAVVADAAIVGRRSRRTRGLNPSSARQPEQPLQDVPDTDRPERRALTEGRHVLNGYDAGWQEAASRLSAFRATVGWGQWSIEPDVGRMAHGVPARVDRLKGLGNAVVPQVAELVGRAIVAHSNQKRKP